MVPTGGIVVAHTGAIVVVFDFSGIFMQNFNNMKHNKPNTVALINLMWIEVFHAVHKKHPLNWLRINTIFTF